MEEIIRFVLLAQTGRFTVTELCEQWQMSLRSVRHQPADRLQTPGALRHQGTKGLKDQGGGGRGQT
jgi:hypothetical protein